MKKLLIIIYFSMISSVSFAGSCPMLWNKVDIELSNLNASDENYTKSFQVFITARRFSKCLAF